MYFTRILEYSPKVNLSRLLPRSILKEPIEIYFIFFRVVMYFTRILELYTIFWNYKRIWKMGNMCTVLALNLAWGLALLAHPKGWNSLHSPCQPSVACAQRTRSPRGGRRWRRSCRQWLSGAGSAGLAGGAPEETREHTGHGGKGGVSPRWLVGGEAVWRRTDDGVPPMVELRWAAAASGWVCSTGRRRGMWGIARLETGGARGQAHRSGGNGDFKT
jgi:hypothetical protein